MRWEELRSEQFKEAIEKSGGLCIVPIGCIEKHGQHLPVGTDGYEATEVCLRAVEMEDAVVFPTGFWLGDLTGAHAVKNPVEENCAGFIVLKPSTVQIILEELCDEIARNGFRKILFVNAHGGNKAMLSYFLRNQGYEKKNYSTMVITKFHDRKTLCDELLNNLKDYPMLTEEDVKVLEHYRETGFGGGHADFVETARVMANHPELVAPDRFDAESGLSTHMSDHLENNGIKTARSWNANYPNHYCGFAPHGVSQAIGQAIVEHTAKKLAAQIKLIKEDEECVKIAKMEW